MPFAWMSPPPQLPSLASLLRRWPVLPASHPSGPHHHSGPRRSPKTDLYREYFFSPCELIFLIDVDMNIILLMCASII